MTEKITRRGIKTPDSYEPDILETISVSQVMNQHGVVLSEKNTIGELRQWLQREPDYQSNYFIIVGENNSFLGIISSSSLFGNHQDESKPVTSLIKRTDTAIRSQQTLRDAVEMMAKENLDILPVVSNDNSLAGMLSYKNIISSYKSDIENKARKNPVISLKRSGLKMLVHGQKLRDFMRGE